MILKNSILRTAGLMIGGLILLCPWPVEAAQQPDAGQIVEEHKQPPVKLPQKQESQLTVDEPERPPFQDTGEKIWVRGFRFSGQKIISNAELQKIVANDTPKWLSLAQIKELAARVGDLFRLRGYLFTRSYVPAQEMKNSVVEIAIIVGRYDQVIIRKNVDVAENIVRLELGDVKSGAYIKKNSLERAIWLLNDLVGVEAKASLTPGGKTGTSNLILDLAPKGARISGNVTADNYGNRFTGKYEGADFTAFNNPLHCGDLFTFYGASAGNGFTNGSLSYQLPLLMQGGKLELSYSRMGYVLGEDFAYLGAHGTADTINVAFNQTLKRSKAGNIYGQVGYAVKKLQDLTAATTSEKYSNDLTVMLKGDGFDNWGGGGANSYSASYTSGYHGINSSEDQVIDAATAQTAGSFGKWNFTLARQQFISDRLALVSFANGQLANKNLDSSEKMSLGGASGVRAYPPGEASGDQAFLINTELRWTIPLRGRSKEKGKQGRDSKDNSPEKSGSMIQLSGFYDYGWAMLNRYPWTDARNERSLQGTGLGLTWSRPGKVTLKIYYAWKIGSEAAISDTDKTGRLWVQGVFYY